MMNYEQLVESYQGKTDSQVAEVIKCQDDYTPEAVAAAVSVLKERGIDVPKHINRDERLLEERASHKPPSTANWITLVVLSILIPFVELFWLMPNSHPTMKKYARIIFKIRAACVFLAIIIVIAAS